MMCSHNASLPHTTIPNALDTHAFGSNVHVYVPPIADLLFNEVDVIASVNEHVDIQKQFNLNIHLLLLWMHAFQFADGAKLPMKKYSFKTVGLYLWVTHYKCA